MVRMPAVSLSGVPALPVELPTRRLQQVWPSSRPTSFTMHHRSCRGRAGWPQRADPIPTVAVDQTDLAGFAQSYGAG
jgi:hypothetical protein